MPKRKDRSIEPLSLRVSPEVKEVLEKIAEIEDRPIGYVARELMLRGLNLYKEDGVLNPKVVEAKIELQHSNVIISLEDEEKLLKPLKKAS